MLVLGIRNQFLIAAIHDPIQVLQRRTQIAPFLFVFRRRGTSSISRHRVWSGADLFAVAVAANAAPPKNKKNNLWVFVAINRPPLRGFKPSRVFSPR